MPVGTEGAISIEGTLAGFLGGLIVCAIVVYGTFGVRVTLVLAACAFLGSYVESVIGSWNRKQPRPIPNGVLNFINTAVGAALAISLV